MRIALRNSSSCSTIGMSTDPQSSQSFFVNASYPNFETQSESQATIEPRRAKRHYRPRRGSKQLRRAAMFLTPGHNKSGNDTSGVSHNNKIRRHERHASRGSFMGSIPRQEALVTLFKRESSYPTSAPLSPASSSMDTVSMSKPGQRVIPATFNLVPIKSLEDTAPNTNVPPNFTQAGGHNDTFKVQGATLLKKVSDREAAFYEAAEEGAWPTSLLPKFYGRGYDGTIKIENLTHGFKRPCVIDLKMGVQTVENDEASFLKRLKMTALDHFTRSKSAGCRLEGLSMYRTLENRFVKGTKAQSHSLSAHVRVSLQDVLTFFLTDESGVRTDVALRFQMGIERILEQFKQNHTYKFIGSSILLIYDNDNRAPYMHWARALRKLHLIAPHVRLSEDQVSGLTRRTRCDVRMIDFAHTSTLAAGVSRDDGYITGLQTILKALKAIRVYRSKPIFSMSNAIVDVMEEQRAQKRAAALESGEIDLEERFTFSSVLGDLTALTTNEERLSPSASEEETGLG